MANKTFSEALDELDWNAEAVKDLQTLLIESDHTSVCSGGKEPDGPPPSPPPGFKPNKGRGAGGQGRFPPRGPPPSGFDGKNGPPPGFDPNGPPPPLPPELEAMLKINYPKLEKYYAPPQTCSNINENAIDS